MLDRSAPPPGARDPVTSRPHELRATPPPQPRGYKGAPNTTGMWILLQTLWYLLDIVIDTEHFSDWQLARNTRTF